MMGFLIWILAIIVIVTLSVSYQSVAWRAASGNH